MQNAARNRIVGQTVSAAQACGGRHNAATQGKRQSARKGRVEGLCQYVDSQKRRFPSITIGKYLQRRDRSNAAEKQYERDSREGCFMACEQFPSPYLNKVLGFKYACGKDKPPLIGR